MVIGWMAFLNVATSKLFFNSKVWAATNWICQIHTVQIANNCRINSKEFIYCWSQNSCLVHYSRWKKQSLKVSLSISAENSTISTWFNLTSMYFIHNIISTEGSKYLLKDVFIKNWGLSNFTIPSLHWLFIKFLAKDKHTWLSERNKKNLQAD